MSKGSEQGTLSTVDTQEDDPVGNDPGDFCDNDGKHSDWDKSNNHLNSMSSSATALPKCVCSWKNCRAYQKAFREAKKKVFDGVVQIKLVQAHSESMSYKECLDRTLGVTKAPVWKNDSRTGGSYCKYVVARHHFTEQHLNKYDANPKQFSFIKPFSLHGAKKYLFSINMKETYNVGPGSDYPSEQLFMQCPNVPSEVVKVEYYKCMEIVNSEINKNGTTMTTNSSVISKVQHTTAKNVANSKKTPTYCKSSIKSYRSPNDNIDDTKSVNSFISSAPVEVLNAENKLLKDQLDAMKDQLTFLHDMVQKLQAQHLDTASVYSNKSRRSRTSSRGGHVTTNTSSTNRQNQQQKSAQYYEQHPLATNNTRAGRRGSVGGNSSVGGGTHVPDEINFDDDDTESHTLVSRWNEDDYDSDGDEERTQFTNGTFQSRFNKSMPLPPHADNDDDDDDDDSEDEHDVDHSDDFDYNECMSLGASTILSTSRSIKSLPREMDFEEDEESDDDSQSNNAESSHIEEISSNYSHQGSVNTFAVIAPKLGSKQRTKVNYGSNTPRNAKNANRRGSTTSNTSSTGGSVDRPMESATKNARAGRRASIASSAGSTGGANDHSRNNPQSHASHRKSIASSSASSGGSSLNKASSLYQVTNLAVTDPYGEKGTYTGSISRATRMPHGHGRLEYDQVGRWYEGDWKHGRWTGRGILSNGDGDFYKGGLLDDLKHGYGLMKFSDGRTFEGRYFNGQMVQGTMTYQDGSTYDGRWKDGMRHGYGRCVFADNSVYEGDFRDGEFSGRGKMSWNDGGWYEGQWFNGEMHGLGREIRADGSLRHDGQWSKGQPMRRKVQ